MTTLEGLEAAVELSRQRVRYLQEQIEEEEWRGRRLIDALEAERKAPARRVRKVRTRNHQEQSP